MSNQMIFKRKELKYLLEPGQKERLLQAMEPMSISAHIKRAISLFFMLFLLTFPGVVPLFCLIIYSPVQI